MKLQIELSDSALEEAARDAAQRAVSKEVAKQFSDESWDRGSGTLAVHAAVDEAVRSLPLVGLVQRVIAERLEILVRERVDRVLVKAVDKELANRRASGALAGQAEIPL